MSAWDDIRKTIQYAGRNGIPSAWYAARERLREKAAPPYVYEAPTEETLQEQRSLWNRMAAGEPAA
ncbi:MAG: hypothetical protein Q4C60_03745, partial [Eubacteriales bacterium]|nr:hypothetical protein [Eubacteriales bacterium]